MDIKIEIDPVESGRKFTRREKAGIKILILIFRIIFPAKFSHQCDNFFNALMNDLEG